MARWVCNRCFEANDDATVACGRCGLVRGATVAPADVALAPPAAAPAARPWWRTALPIALRFWWVLLIVAGGIGGFIFNAQRSNDGTITRGGNLAITDLRVGDCFSLSDDSATEIQEVSAHPCAESHDYEMIYIGDYAGGGSYPERDGFATWVGDHCLSAFDAYVGLVYEQSAYDVAWFYPTPDAWGAGDRSVQCAVIDPSGAAVTGTLRGAAH